MEHTKDAAPVIPAVVRIFALPIAACDPGKTWKAAADMIARRLRERYGEAVRVEFVEIFSPASFLYQDILDRVGRGEEAPFVSVNDKLIQVGGKLSEPSIRRALDAMLVQHENSNKGEHHAG